MPNDLIEVEKLASLIDQSSRDGGRISNSIPDLVRLAIEDLVAKKVKDERELCAVIAEDYSEGADFFEGGLENKSDPASKRICLDIASEIRKST